MAQQEYILQLQNVVKRFGGITASNDITINVPRGSIYGIIGPNGAGKTTLFNMITGVYDTTEGRVLFEGQQVNGLPTHVIAARGIARTFQNIRLFGDLSVYDNLLTACQKNITYGLLDGILRTEKCRSQERESREFCDRLLEEVGQLLESGLPREATALQAIGYKEFLGVLDGTATVEEAVAEVKLRSRQYAKRQLTWLRRNPDIHWIWWEKDRDFARALQVSTEILAAAGVF